MIDEMIPLEIVGQTSSSFPVAGKIGMLHLKVTGQISSPFLVDGKIGMTYLKVIDQISSPLLVADKPGDAILFVFFPFNNSSFLSIYFSSKYIDAVRLVYKDAGSANLSSPHGIVSSMSHPMTTMSYWFVLSLVTSIIINK
ncbi:unnamed protein product [Cuscuta europaea]|uniref:Uncharacterized protein n=1 Tax=Cuscuta europaea TaxID=41803 RepID=A0A9P0ZCS6_CUSEU|nr:unnamed protein product [Cuscuta europaea]